MSRLFERRFAEKLSAFPFTDLFGKTQFLKKMTTVLFLKLPNSYAKTSENSLCFGKNIWTFFYSWSFWQCSTRQENVTLNYLEVSYSTTCWSSLHSAWRIVLRTVSIHHWKIISAEILFMIILGICSFLCGEMFRSTNKTGDWKICPVCNKGNAWGLNL